MTGKRQTHFSTQSMASDMEHMLSWEIHAFKHICLTNIFCTEIQKSQELPVTAHMSPSWHRLQHHNTVTMLKTGRLGLGDVTAWQISPMSHLHQLQCDYNTGVILISYFVLSREVPWHSD